MNLYYLQSEFRAGRRRIINRSVDSRVNDLDEATMSPFLIYPVEETTTDANGNKIQINSALRHDLIRTNNMVDESGEEKYYIDGTGQLREKANWTPKLEDYI